MIYRFIHILQGIIKYFSFKISHLYYFCLVCLLVCTPIIALIAQLFYTFISWPTATTPGILAYQEPSDWNITNQIDSQQGREWRREIENHPKFCELFLFIDISLQLQIDDKDYWFLSFYSFLVSYFDHTGQQLDHHI